MNTDFSKDEKSLITAAEEVASTLATNAHDSDRIGRPPREAWETYVAAGLKGLLVPKERGGHAARAAVMARMSEILGRVDPIATLTMLPQEYCIAAIASYGAAPEHTELLGRLMSGEISTGFLLTEPDVGSDASAITTLASRNSDGWQLDGAKAWVTNAPYIDEYFVFAQTEANSGARGIAGFLVPRDTNGVNVSDPYDLLGGHVGAICDVAFDGVQLSANRLVVPPGQGLRAALSAIDLARINVSAMCCGALAKALDIALDYTTRRRAFGKTIASFQGLQWQLAEAATDLYAARCMTYHAADVLDSEGRATVEAAHVKKFATRIALRGIDRCMGQMGSNGLKRNTSLPRLFEYAKIAQTLDGTTDVQNVVISRALLEPYRERLTD